MRFVAFILVLTALVFAEVAHAEGEFIGSVLRLDEQTYRIQFVASYYIMVDAGCLGPPPEGLPEGTFLYCDERTQFRLHGAFGIPRNSDCCYFGEDQVLCNAIPFFSYSCQFDFEPPMTESSRLTLEWYIGGDYICQWCWPSFCQSANLCGYGYASGVVYADLPSRIGDSTPLTPAVAVESTPWTAVKQLFR